MSVTMSAPSGHSPVYPNVQRIKSQGDILSLDSTMKRTKEGMSRLLVIAHYTRAALNGSEVELNGNTYRKTLKGYTISQHGEFQQHLSYDEWLYCISRDAEFHYEKRLENGEKWSGILASMKCGIFDFGNICVNQF